MTMPLEPVLPMRAAVSLKYSSASTGMGLLPPCEDLRALEAKGLWEADA